MKIYGHFCALVLMIFTSMASANELKLSYRCSSDQATSFENGDSKFHSPPIKEMSWTPEEGNNLNLVIGERKALIWVRQPYGSNERLLTVFRHRPGKSFTQDTEDIPMGTIGEHTSQVLDFHFEDSALRKVHVRCQIEMGI